MPPVRGRMAASAPSAPFHFTPPFRNPPDPTCGMKRLSRREVFYRFTRENTVRKVFGRHFFAFSWMAADS
ncbi:TPA: hypothetical protein ACFITR_001616 [Neisseria gonorrhoeae]